MKEGGPGAFAPGPPSFFIFELHADRSGAFLFFRRFVGTSHIGMIYLNYGKVAVSFQFRYKIFELLHHCFLLQVEMIGQFQIKDHIRCV